MKTKSSDPIHGIGIDTGGTYTEAVLFDLRKRQVISVSKRPTAHHILELSRT
jgi:N-methylhydantoinase A/oxoprolinase/acetone carboxylase beta subunit